MGMNRGWLAIGFAAVVGALGTLLAQKVSAKLRNDPPKTYALRDDILIHGNQSLREVALTFDDGPRAELVRPMLDILGKYRARSTFFVVGQQVEKSPNLVRRMMNEGHEVANHTYSHPRLDGLNEEQIREELTKCNKAVFQATGANTNLFRPPGMRYDDVVLRAAQDLGYVTIHWNAAAQDFKPQPASEISRKILKSVQPGSVILLHVHPDTLEALPSILESLRSDGYRFVTVSQMLGRLQRPVVVKTNAYGAEPEPEPAAASTVVAHRPVKKAKPQKEPRVNPSPPPPKGVDVPTWN